MIITILFSYNVDAVDLDQEIIIFDFSKGEVKNFNGYYLIKDNSFIIFNNAKVIQINYTYNDQEFYNEKTIDRIITLPKYDGAKLSILYNNTYLNATVLDRTFTNVLNYGMGQYVNNNIFIAPLGFFWGIFISGLFYYNYERRIA